jgi:hypothetical protein
MPTGGEYNGNSQSRLDRLERLMKVLAAEHEKFSEDCRQLVERLKAMKRGSTGSSGDEPQPS